MKVTERRFTQTELGLVMKLEMIQSQLLRDIAKLHRWKYPEYVTFLTDVFLSRTFYSAKNDTRMYLSWSDVFSDKTLVKEAILEVLTDYKNTKEKGENNYARIN